MDVGILLWNKCNAVCDHCAVDSGPGEKPILTDEQIFSLIDECCADGGQPKIGLSGGEAFVYFERLCKIVEYASRQGALVSVNTNGYWGTTVEVARRKLEVLSNLGLRRLIVSTDDFHREYVRQCHVTNVVKACKMVHVEVELQFVATKSSSRLSDFLAEYGDDLLNVRVREIPCHPVGRAREKIAEQGLFLSRGVPQGKCPSAILSVSAAGNVIPCCNAAGHLDTLKIGDIGTPLREHYSRFKNDKLFRLMLREGPKTLLSKAKLAGYKPREDGYVDQCHLCYDLFRDRRVAQSIHNSVDEILFDSMVSEFERNFTAVTGTQYT